MVCWQIKARERLDRFAAIEFSNWCNSKRGKAWKKLKRRISPYAHGFSLPEYHHDLIEALNQDDEEVAKAIMLQHYVNSPIT